MKKTLSLKTFAFTAFLLFFNFSFGQSQKMEVKGTITQVKSLNKAGNVLAGDGDFFIDFNAKSYFVKLSAGSVTGEELKAIMNVKTTFELVILEGLWDTDDPNVQSRVGEYVKIISIQTP
jgi:hypothetical protein